MAILLSVAKFCEQYGFTKGTVYRLARARRIPVIRNGAKLHGLKLDPDKVLRALEQPADTNMTGGETPKDAT